MFLNNRITRSLCAVIVLLAILLPHPLPAKADDVNDTYALDIEFGNLSFYYDFGVWNPNTMRYEASAGSTYPAEGTVAGFPGWYGFDGIANKITVHNISPGGHTINVALNYRQLAPSELGEAGMELVGQVSNVTMTVPDWAQSGNLFTHDVPADTTRQTPAVAYIQLAGEPRLTSGTFSSNYFAPIGMLTVSIQSWTS